MEGEEKNIVRKKSRKRDSIKDAFRFAINKIRSVFPTYLQNTILTTRPAIEAIGNIYLYRHTDYGLLLSSATVGIIIGIFVAIFHSAIDFAGGFFEGIITRSKTSDYWYLIVFPLIPAIGGLGVGLLRRSVFKIATHEGLHTVVDALIHRDGKIDWRNSFKSIIYAALSISSGGGAGREGPTVVLGASLGSTFAQLFKLRPQQLRVLCGSGAAAAISAIFNAPLGGIVFALEAIIGETRIRTFAPLVISSVLSTATVRVLVGNHPLLVTPELSIVTLNDYILLAIVGMLGGFVAIYYLKAYHNTESFIKKRLIRFPDYLQPAVGGLLAGIILLLLPTMWETNYDPVNQVIAGKGEPLINNSIFEYLIPYFKENYLIILSLLAAAATVLVKPISNAITLASNGAGGTMAPVIKTGAMFGFCFGAVVNIFFPELSPGLYALVGAAAVLSATYQIPLTGGIVLFEICHNYDLILPLIFSSVFAAFIVQRVDVKTFNPIAKSKRGDF
jgi:chloride channel protein, CIC family